MANGFVQGFGMMNNFMQQQDAKERQAAADAENTRRYNESLSRQDRQWQHSLEREQKQDAIADENRRLDFASKGITGDMTPEQREGVMLNQRAITLQQAEEDRQWGREKDKLQMQATKAQINNYWLDAKAKNREFKQQDEQDAFQKFIAYGDFNALNQHQQGFITGLVKRKPEFDIVQNRFGQLESAFASENDPNRKQEIAHEMAAMFSTPEGRNVLNSAVHPDLSARLSNNPNINKISAAGLVPMNGGIALMLDIEYKDGTIAKGVPATKNKTGDMNDEVSIVPIPALRKNMEQAFSLQNAAIQHMKENPAFGRSVYGMKPGDEVKSGYSQFNVLTGEPIANGKSTDNGINDAQVVRSLDQTINEIGRNIFSLRKEAESASGDSKVKIEQQIAQLQAQRDKYLTDKDAILAGASRKEVGIGLPANSQATAATPEQPSTTGGFNIDVIKQRLQMMQNPKQ
jgi:hypothetical protein